MSKAEVRLVKRNALIRSKLSGTPARPRLSVYRSLNHIYAQVVDDANGKTVAFASSLSKELKGGSKEGDKKADAKRVGKLIAQKCKAAQVEVVVFDRNGFPYHGRRAAVAEAGGGAGR